MVPLLARTRTYANRLTVKSQFIYTRTVIIQC